MKNAIRIDNSFATPAEKSLKSLTESLEAYKKLSRFLTSSMNEIMKAYSAYSKNGIDGIVESLRKTMDSYAKINEASGMIVGSIPGL